MGNELKISKIVSSWIENQRELAKLLGITSASVSVMLSGKAALPLGRFLQIVHLIKPPVDEVEKAFNLYIEDLGISGDDMRIVFRSYGTNTLQDDTRASVHRMIDNLNEQQLAALKPVLELMK
jgi:predicted transcriptional regulator